MTHIVDEKYDWVLLLSVYTDIFSPNSLNLGQGGAQGHCLVNLVIRVFARRKQHGNINDVALRKSDYLNIILNTYNIKYFKCSSLPSKVVINNYVGSSGYAYIYLLGNLHISYYSLFPHRDVIFVNSDSIFTLNVKITKF